MMENSMDSENGHQNPRRAHFQQLSVDEDGDFVNNFRDVGVNAVDKYARIVFPLSYLLFNICYWIIYLST